MCFFAYVGVLIEVWKLVGEAMNRRGGRENPAPRFAIGMDGVRSTGRLAHVCPHV